VLLRTSLALLATALLAYTLGVHGQPTQKPAEKSPHAAALELVFKQQADRIRDVDRENWWHDVKERTWVVKRPFHPGVIDSTHLFDVSYRIAGREVATWTVDTRRGQVTVTPAGPTNK
jgi:hypothetical protein